MMTGSERLVVRGTDPDFLAAIPHAPHGFDQIVAQVQFFAQADHLDIHDALCDRLRFAAHILHNLAATEHLARVLREQLQNPEFGIGQMYFAALHSDLMSSRVNDQRPVFDWRRFIGIRLGDARAPQDGLHAGHEHRRIERFGHVVIGADFKAGNNVFLAIFGGEHDDGDGAQLAVLLHLAAHGQAVHTRQHEIKQNQHDGAAFQDSQRLFARAGDHRRILVLFEVELQQFLNVRLILNDQYIFFRHGAPPSPQCLA